MMHAAPSLYCADNQAKRPKRGRKGAVEKVAKRKRLPRSHEARAPRKRASRGKPGNVKRPRFLSTTTF